MSGAKCKIRQKCPAALTRALSRRPPQLNCGARRPRPLTEAKTSPQTQPRAHIATTAGPDPDSDGPLATAADTPEPPAVPGRLDRATRQVPPRGILRTLCRASALRLTGTRPEPSAPATETRRPSAAGSQMPDHCHQFSCTLAPCKKDNSFLLLPF